METTTLPAPVPATLNGNAVALTQPAGNPLAMPVPVQAVIARHEAIQEIVKGVFKNGTHFGEIPGTAKNKDGSAKMVLLKAGFDTLCEAFQFSPDFVKQPESIETDKFINLVYKCVLNSASGRAVATGIGSCNSKEEKYRWKPGAKRACPGCGKTDTLLKSKDKPEWFCWRKKDGCGATYPINDPQITSQKVEREENDNAWNHHNTLTKMAQKRAGMAAIITACGISGDFTQDMEDFGEPDPNAKNARGEAGIDIHTNHGPHDGEQPRGENRSYDVHDDRPPQEWRDELEGAATQAEDATFTAAPAVPPDIQKAIDEVTLELRYCKTKEQFQRLVSLMRTQGGPMKDARVTAVFNAAYYAAFPKTTPAPSAP